MKRAKHVPRLPAKDAKKVTGVETKRLPESRKYFWKLLGALYKDLESHLPPVIAERFAAVIVEKDFSSFLLLIQDCSLNKLKYCEYSVTQIRAMRMICTLKKYQYPGNKLRRREKAFKKFFEAENVCKAINAQQPFINHKNRLLKEHFLQPVMENAQDFCKKVLGNFKLMEIFEGAYFGPGSTLETVKSRTGALDKLKPPLTVTLRALPYVRSFLLTDDRWLRSLITWYLGKKSLFSDCSSHTKPFSGLYLSMNQSEREEFWNGVIKVVPGNRVTFVPKNADEDRTITIEPLINLMLQLGVKHYLQNRLKQFGFDLTTQVKNQTLAMYASVTDDLVTIDVKGASEHLPSSVIKFLLPPEWYRFLDNIRSHEGSGLHVGTVQYQKFSSMGNGFTFVLQTLMYASLIYGVVTCQGEELSDNLPNIAVYGDDIILPKRYYGDFATAMHWCGLSFNRDKTFSEGPIRESCGCDCYLGKRINVFSIQDSPRNIVEVCIRSNLYTSMFREYFEEVPAAIQALHLDWVPDTSCVYGPLDMNHVAHWFFETTAPVVDLCRCQRRWCTDIWMCNSYRRIHGYSAKRIKPKIPRFLLQTFGFETNALKGSSDGFEQFWSCSITSHVQLSTSRFLGPGRDWPIRLSRRSYMISSN